MSVALFNHTLGRVTGRRAHFEAVAPIDIYGVANIILESQAHSLFEVGFVNGDPHPGNIILLDSGKVGLIDWGQARQYDANERCALAKLLIALSARDEVLTAQCLREMGHKTEKD